MRGSKTKSVPLQARRAESFLSRALRTISPSALLSHRDRIDRKKERRERHIVRLRAPGRQQAHRLQCSPAGDVRTQEVSRFVQLGEPTGRRLMAESARRRSEAVAATQIGSVGR